MRKGLQFGGFFFFLEKWFLLQNWVSFGYRATDQSVNVGSSERPGSSNMDINFIGRGRYITGLELISLQVYTLLQKKFLYMSRSLLSIFWKVRFRTNGNNMIKHFRNIFSFSPDLWQVIVTTAISLLLLRGTSELEKWVNKPLTFDIATYPGSTVILQRNNTKVTYDSEFRKYAERNRATVNVSETADIVKGVEE